MTPSSVAVSQLAVPYFRPDIDEVTIERVVTALRSGWLTTGQLTREFERRFANAVGAEHAVALNSATAALHLALEAAGVRRGDVVLVPTMTFAATAEVVRYFDATPVFVDVNPATLNIDVGALGETLRALAAGQQIAGVQPPFGPIRAIMPVDYGGLPADLPAVRAASSEFGARMIEDAAHAFPAGIRTVCGFTPVGAISDVTCFSFYANKTITTGEGGMATTNDAALAERMRLMSLHGMSKDAWKRFTASGSWYYEIVAPGFKYNLTDIASAIGLGQLERAQEFRDRRAAIAAEYTAAFRNLDAIELLAVPVDREHAWHLFVLKLRLDALRIDRARFIDEMRQRGVQCSVHWLPLHMQPYYRETYGYEPGLFPNAHAAWPRLVSLPLFPAMRPDESAHVVAAVRDICGRFAA